MTGSMNRGLAETRLLVNSLAKDLSEERTNRVQGQEDFKKRLEEMSKETTGMAFGYN
jgi:hypothetical protein